MKLVLEDGNVKIGSVVSDVFGVAGVKVLRKLADGVTRADLLALECPCGLGPHQLGCKSV